MHFLLLVISQGMPKMRRTDKTPTIRAAEYVRMSTEHQRYSIGNQAEAIRRYAEAHGMEVVRTYRDAGRSGLLFKNRAGLQDLIRDVVSGQVNFSAVLVYDVSRWGRFQDTDESAHYEFLCRHAQVEVHYCAEPFVNDGSVASTLLKAVKRTMAGEFSRELSNKVFAGKCRLARLGFRQGGHAGFGLRRQLVDQDGNPKLVLNRGDRKSIQTDRVILIPGPIEEISIVQEIFERYVRYESCQSIAQDFNDRAILTEHSGKWTRSIVQNILTNPKYVGTNLINRTSTKLSGTQVRNPSRVWIEKTNAFRPIIRKELFDRAQDVHRSRTCVQTDEEILTKLRSLLSEQGYLSNSLLDESVGLPSRTTVFQRFGGMLQAYKLVGYEPGENYDYVVENRRLLGFEKALLQEVAQLLRGVGAAVEDSTQIRTLVVNGQFSISLLLVRCRKTKYRGNRWQFKLNPSRKEDITLAVRMAPGNETIMDYYLLPRIDHLGPHFDLELTNSFLIDMYQFSDLSPLVAVCRFENADRRRSRMNSAVDQYLKEPVKQSDRVTHESPTRDAAVLVRRASEVKQRLGFIAAAFGNLLEDDDFVAVLREEHFDRVPSVLNRTTLQRKDVDGLRP